VSLFQGCPSRGVALYTGSFSSICCIFQFSFLSRVFQNGRLSFVPEDYGKPSTTPTSASVPAATPTSIPHKKQKAPAQLAQQPEDLPEGMYRCEFCGHVEHKAKFLAPSRRFCSLTCCKRYSAEKRYYPYGKDEEGIAQSIREGLLNPNRSSSKPGRGSKQVREERRRRLAFYSKSPSQDPGPSGDTVPRRPVSKYSCCYYNM
jgi:hypothetical protein